MFSSSRTFPGQEYPYRDRMTSGSTSGMDLPSFSPNFLEEMRDQERDIRTSFPESGHIDPAPH